MTSPQPNVTPAHLSSRLLRAYVALDLQRFRTVLHYRNTLLIAVVAWILVGSWYGIQAWFSTSDQAWFQLDSVAALAGAVSQQHFDQYLHGFDFLNVHLAQDSPDIGSANSVPLNGLLRQFRKTYPDLVGVGILSPTGQIMFGSGRFDEGETANPQTRRFLAYLRHHPGVQVGPSNIGLARGSPTIQLGAAHVRGQNRPRFYLVADVDMRRQISLWHRLRLPDYAARHIVMGLLTQQGQLLGVWPERQQIAEEGVYAFAQTTRRALVSSIHTPSGHFSGTADAGLLGAVVWGAFSRLRDIPVAAFVTVPRSAVWLAWWRRVQIPLLGWIVLSSLLGVLSYGFAHARRKELQQTLRASEAERAARQAAVFYAALAETLRVLRDDEGHVAADIFQSLSATLSDVLDACVVFVGRLSKDSPWLDIVASAGPARAYTDNLRISATSDIPEGRGPAGLALRSGLAQHLSVNDPLFAPWAVRARAFGIGGILSAAGRTQTGEAVVICVHYPNSNRSLDQATGVAQQIADELAEFLDRQSEIAQALRRERYRNALRTIQHRLLSAADEESVYAILAQTLAAETDAEAVEVFVPDAGELKRRAVAGSLSQALAQAPNAPLRHIEPGPRSHLRTRVWISRSPQIIYYPSNDYSLSERWRQPPLSEMGLLAGWPILALGSDVIFGIVTLITKDANAVDVELQELVCRIMEGAAIALRQVRDRAHIEWLACSDPLTGLHNRRSLLQQIPASLARARRQVTKAAICVLDLDDFKPVNDTWGHAAGDALLCELSQRLRTTLRGADHIARLGGDEFVVVIEDLASTGELEAILSRLEAAVRLPYMLPSGHQARIGVSIGLTVYPEDDSTAEILLRHADDALYCIKGCKAMRERCWMVWSHGASASMLQTDWPSSRVAPNELSASTILAWNRAP